MENIFDSRYRHVDELSRMGADIRVEGRVAVVYGVPRLHGAQSGPRISGAERRWRWRAFRRRARPPSPAWSTFNEDMKT